MFKKIIRNLQKDKYIRVVKFNSDKSSTVSYYKNEDFKPSYLIDPNHVFFANGFRSILITDNSAQTINPLDFESKYPVERFKSAIESKLISETFNTLKKK